MRIRFSIKALNMLLPLFLGAQTITVNWDSRQQQIDGFGGSAADTTDPSGFSSTVSDFFFRSDTGIGLSILRLQIVPSKSECDAYFNIANGYGFNGTCVTASSGTILSGELTVAQQAQARGVSRFFATQWSPSGTYKSNGQYASGGSLLGNSSNYTAIATELADFVSLLTGTYGISLYGIGPQNEPTISQSYPSALWSAQQFHDFVPYLSTALSNAGYSGVKIMIAEDAGWGSNFPSTATAMADAAVASEVGTLTAHTYSGCCAFPSIPNVTTQHFWETETSSQASTYDGSISDALPWAVQIHSLLSNGVNAFVWWFLSDQVCCGNGSDNAALTDFNGNFPKRAYITGNWSKFVRPGWYRVGVTNPTSLSVTAFTNSGNTQGAVVIVNNSSQVSQAFSVGNRLGYPVHVWITDSTRSLSDQGAVVPVSGVITYTIPANSVVTFAGTGSVVYSTSHDKGSIAAAKSVN